MKSLITACIVALAGGSAFCGCSSDEIEEIQFSQSQNEVKKRNTPEVYDYLYAKIENVDLRSHFNRAYRVYPFLPGGGEITQMPSIEAEVEYALPNPDYYHTTVVLKVYDHNATEIPVNSPDGGIAIARLNKPCGFAFAFYDAYDPPQLGDFKAVDWYSATIETYNSVGFFPPIL